MSCHTCECSVGHDVSCGDPAFEKFKGSSMEYFWFCDYCWSGHKLVDNDPPSTWKLLRADIKGSLK